MVNSYSASASEYFASAMQDYNRAIIVGTPTHGKSSAQTIIPLSMDESKKLGYAKLTIEKFYQVTGQSIQSKGEIPDIILPSIYSGLKLEEKHKKHAFTNDSITVKLKHFPLKTINVSELKSKSEERVNSNASFNSINELNTLILERYFGNKHYEIPVTLKDIRNYIESYTKAWDTLNDLIFEVDLKTEIFNTQATSEILEYNQEDKDTNAILMDTISNDIHINETLNILIDYINQNNIN
jgi:carboxyl-terminal processing protease